MMIGIAGVAFGSPLLFSVLFEDRHRRPLHVVMLNGYINEGERNSPLHKVTASESRVRSTFGVSERSKRIVECAAASSAAVGALSERPFINEIGEGGKEMAVSCKGKRRLTYKGKEYIWSIRENYEGFFADRYNVFHELHITAADKSFSTIFPLRPDYDDDGENYNRMKEYLGIDFDIPEAVTLSFVAMIIEREDRYFVIERHTEKIPQIHIGSGKSYTVMNNVRPILSVEVSETSNPFDTAYIFGKWLCIGSDRKAYFVDIETAEYHEMDIPMYFGSFREFGGRLYIFTGVGIIALDNDMNKLWQNDSLAVDGVTGGELSADGKYLTVSCELDPPGGWVDTTISTETGR